MKHIGSNAAKIRPDQLVYFGLRDFEDEEFSSDFEEYQQSENSSDQEQSNASETTGGETKDVVQKKGYMSIFPSFIVHKVTPITSGKRKSLVAWFTGPDWR